MAARTFLAGAALALTAAAGGDVPCAESGVAYADPAVEVPNGGFVDSAKTCQHTCHDMVFCEHFSYWPNSSACWLLGDKATKETSKEDVISGPASCEVSNSSGVEAGGMEAGGGGGMPGWCWLLVIVGVIAVCIAVAYVTGLLGGDEKKKKKKKKTKREAPSAPDDEESAGMLPTPLPSVPVQPLATVGSPLMTTSQPMPMYVSGGFGGPPVQAMTMPMLYTGQQVYTEPMQQAVVYE
mmetsp:Transcript_107157/g.228833  ORF Transcript_107157/g.228833 Transcript_107157/m.228833 type:complete len:238 (+) Transcript_107157:83-796(+)